MGVQARVIGALHVSCCLSEVCLGLQFIVIGKSQGFLGVASGMPHNLVALPALVLLSVSLSFSVKLPGAPLSARLLKLASDTLSGLPDVYVTLAASLLKRTDALSLERQVTYNIRGAE